MCHCMGHSDIEGQIDQLAGTNVREQGKMEDEVTKYTAHECSTLEQLGKPINTELANIVNDVLINLIDK